MKLGIIMAIIGLAVVAVAASLLGKEGLNQKPAGEGDWGYRPVGEKGIETNPPAFTWRPTRGMEAYLLQIASDTDFENLVYESSDIPWTAHCPSSPLPSGRHYWRYAGVDAEGRQTGWSKTRSFLIAANLPVLPQPLVTDLLSRISVDHPRLFLRPENLPAWREMAVGPLATPAATLLAYADSVLASPPDTTEPPLYPDDIVPRGGEWMEIWRSNRFRTIDVVGAAASLGLAYRLTGNEQYGQLGVELLMAFSRWDPAGATNYRYNDEAAMPSLNYPARAFTWLWPLLSAREREEITAVMRIRGRDCFDHLRASEHLWHPYNSHSNRSWHWLGEVAITFYDVIPEAQEWLDYVMTIMYSVYPAWSGEDGGWHEGLGYWHTYLTRYMYWADVTRSAFGIDVFERPVFQKLGDFGLYVSPPGTQCGGFGDLTVGVTSESVGELMAGLAAATGNPYWQWYADSVGGQIDDFVHAAAITPVVGRSPTDLPSSKLFRTVGLAVLNTDLLDGTQNVQVQFKSNSTLGTYSHGYNANNSFLLNLKGESVFLRSGRRDLFRSDHHVNWMWHTKSDNAILVNGEGQYKRTYRSKGLITAFATSPTIDVTAGEAGDAYENLDRWTRRLVFLKPHALLIHDILEAPEPSTYQWLLHAPSAFEIITDAALWQGAPGRADVSFLHPPEMAITQTNRFSSPPADWTEWKLEQWHLTAEPSQAARRQEFLTIVVIDGAAVEWTTAYGDDGTLSGVSISLPGETVEIILQDEEFSVRATGFNETFLTAGRVQ